MLVAVKSAPFFLFTHHALEGAGFALTAATLWFRYVWPWLKPRVRNWRDNRFLMKGRPAVDGVTEEVPPLRRRLKRIEKRQDDFTAVQTETTDTVKRLDAGQVAIVDRMDRHEGVVSEIKGQVAQIADGQTRALTMLSHLFENGKNSNNPGDLNARMAESQGVYLEHPDVATFDPHRDDGKAP